ncbi:aminoglycoside adenylyltransferase domain-containing protein [Geodermatophilus sp. SYSU D00691]
MTTVETPQGRLQLYADQVARRVHDALRDRLAGVWLLGSAALGDYDPWSSDIDVQAVATERLTLSERRELASRLEHEVLPTPARGLEFVLYAAEDLHAAGGPRFQLNLNTGPRMEHHLVYDAEQDPSFWFTIDVSIARQSGVALLGPPAAVVFAEPPRSLVATAVIEALDFYAGAPDATDQAVLSACRAWGWATDGVWRSKADSARWAMQRLTDSEPVERALRRRRGEPGPLPTEQDLDRVLTAARAALSLLGAPE